VSGLVEPRFVYPHLLVPDAATIFARVGGDLADAGRVRPSFVAALTAREQAYPTGLPVPGGVAIPHTDAEHVIADTICVLTLAEPVGFRSMGGPDDATIAVSTVFLLALSRSQDHVTILPRIVRSIQDQTFLARLAASDDPAQIADLVNAAFSN